MLEQTLFELTSPQKNIYMREQFYNGTPINNLSFTFYMKKDFDADICVKVLNKIVEENDGLRVKIKSTENGVFQYVEDFIYEDFPIKICKDKSIDDLKIEMQDDAKIPFIFQNSKLYKFVIYKLNNDETAIYIKIHHIIGDAWVTKILFRQFNEYYKLFANNLDVNVSHPSYLNFLDNEKKYLSSNSFEKDKLFWEKYSDNLPEAIPFKEICVKKTTQSKRYTQSIDFSDEINSYCKSHSFTPYNFFIAVYSIYLLKVQSKTDFTIGTPLLNRKNVIYKDTVGMFVSTVPLKIHVSNDDNIIDFISSLSLKLIGILRHERYPYTEILNYVHSQDTSNSNLFDTIISYQNIRPDLENVDYEFEHFWNFSASQQTSLELHITDYNGEGKYFLSLDYNEAFCNENEIQLVFNRLSNIMKEILSGSFSNISDIDIMDESEKNLVLNKFNSLTTYSPNKPLITLFDEQVRKHPSNIALKFENTELTYKELDNRINTFASYMRDFGISGNVPVCILVERSLDMVISMLATLRVGAYYVTIDPFWPNDRVNYIIHNSSSKFLITHRKYAEFHKTESCIFIDDIDYSKKCLPVKSNIKMTDFAYVIYTSGSTGKPKGTMMTNININNLLNSTYKNFVPTDKDVWTLFHTYTFDFSAWEIYGSLTHGGKLVIVPKEITVNPSKMLDLVIDEKVTILNQTPAYFYKVLDAMKLSNKKIIDLRLVILGGEAVFAEPLKYWKERYPDIPIYNGYGPTETTIFAIMGEITDSDIKNNNILIGRPLDNYYITIVNKFGEALGIGCEGEICITSKSVCSGYFNNEEMTKQKFIKTSLGTLYKSGDVGYFDQDGRIKYIGRNDNQVKIRGFRVELEEIEKELLKCQDVSKAVVFPIENNNYTKSLIGFIETQRADYTNSVLDQIRKNLTSYMIPKLYQVSVMPINDNGKIDRKKLLENVKSIKKDIVLPKTDLEKKIYNIICAQKNVSNLSIKDDFFQDIGLDSLDVMQLATTLSEYNVEIQRINNNSTIESLADAIANNKKDVAYISELYNIQVTNKKFRFDLSSVFLTGSTGFLGIHILRELIDNPKVKKIYCLIRYKDTTNPIDRLRNSLKLYFSDYSNSWMDKVIAIAGNFEDEFLGLDKNYYFEICNQITTVIHCGANVKHFGNYNSFYKTNVIGTENIIKLAYDSNAKLAHISTLSVGGFSDVSEKKVLTEKEININQSFNNHVYMITKYEAECKVLDAISKGWVNAKIFRLGNIMPRFSDGHFQKNRYDNGFLARIKTILDTKSIPSSYSKLKFDLSPVDLCAKSIVKLLNISASNTIYHIFNNNMISVKKLFKKYKLASVSVEDEITKIKNLKSPYSAHLLNDLLNPSKVETPASNMLTLFKLNKAGFRWNRVNDKYLDKIFNILKD